MGTMADNPNLINGLSNGQSAYIPSGIFAGGFTPGLPISTQSAQNTVEQRQREMTTIQTHSFNTNPKYFVHMTCEEYSRQNATTMAQGNITDRLILPMPAQMIDAQKVIYSQEELGAIGGAALNAGGSAINNIRNTFNNVYNNTSAGVAGATGAAAAAGVGSILPSAAGAAGAAGSLAFQALPENVKNTVQAAVGIAPNQFMVILLKGPSYKKFTMDWSISPKSPEQARALNTTIKMLKNAQAPSITLGGFFFTFPKIFRIAYKPDNEFLYTFKPCVLEDLTVNYTGDGIFAPTRIGAPNTIKVSMHFLEVEFWLRGQYV